MFGGGCDGGLVAPKTPNGDEDNDKEDCCCCCCGLWLVRDDGPRAMIRAPAKLLGRACVCVCCCCIPVVVFKLDAVEDDKAGDVA